MSDNNNKLAKLRTQIDRIDDEIISQLIKRIAVVKEVGELKSRTNDVPCPIRAGREAEMVRDIVKRFGQTDFPAVSAAAIWRIIIGTSTGVEAKLNISVFADDRENSLYWLAREYFASSSPIVRQKHVKRVIGDVIDGKAAVGVVPFLKSNDTSDWWTGLMQHGENVPKIFACVPFVYNDSAKPAGLAIARLKPEPSGDDMSFVVIEADANVSQSRLQTAFIAAKLEVSWINVATLSPASRHHLVEIRGFVTAENEGFSAFLAGLGASVFATHFLGAYAVPVTISDS